MTPNARQVFGPDGNDQLLARARWAALALAAGAVGAVRAEEATRLDPLDVTGERVTEPLVTPPAAVTSYDGVFLAENGITDYQDLAPLTPGFFVSEQSPDGVSLNLRGITSDSGDPRQRPRVSVFQDGVGLNSPHGNGVALFDVDEIAVFKGPQPTRFSEGVESGAIALTSKRPDGVAAASIMAGVGEHDAREAEVVVNAPVVADKLSARVAFYANEREGYVTNLADGSDLQGEDTVALRTSLRWRPGAATTADLIFNLQRDDTPGVAFKSAVIPVGSPPSTDTDPYTAANLTRGEELGVEREITGLTGLVRHELNDAWTVVSTSSWRRVKGVHEFDADGSYLYLLELGEDYDGTQLGQEVRFEYDGGGRFTASSGVRAAWSEGDQTTTIRTDENTLWSFLTGTPPPLPLNPRYVEHSVNKAEALSGDVFGRADYKLTDRLTLGGGLRLTQERLVSRYQSFAAPTPSSLPLPLVPTGGGGNTIFQVSDGEIENSAEVGSWSGQLDASYVVTPRLTAFTAVSRGRRPPVLDFNEITLAPVRHAEEELWNYEAGIRGVSPGKRVRYDASVFQYYFDHFQTERVTSLGVSEPFDGGRARGQGFETTVRADVARELTLFASYGFTDAEFSARSEDGETQAFAGNAFRLTSRHVVSLGGTLSLPGPRAGTVFITPLYTYRSAYFFEDDNAQNGGILKQEGFGLVNLRVGYRASDGSWEVVGYMNNVFDQEYLLDAGNTGGYYGLPTRIPAAPRMVGVRGTVRF